jgi:hypothetical protein
MMAGCVLQWFSKCGVQGPFGWSADFSKKDKNYVNPSELSKSF